MVPPFFRSGSNKSSCGIWILALAVCLAPSWVLSGAQTRGFDATNLREPTDLAAGWLVHAGDDPAYARSDFDDSNWTPFNAATDSLHALFPSSRPEVVWYRLRIKVAPGQTDLALLETYIGPAFEIHLNGVRLLKVGQVTPFVPYNFNAEILLPIPKDQIATETIIVALRVRTSSMEWAGPFPGYYSTNLTIGQKGALREHMWLTIIGANASRWAENLTNLAMGIGALLLFLAQRERTEYLWLLLVTLCYVPDTALSLFSLMHTYPGIWDIPNAILVASSAYFVMRMYCAFVGHKVGWKLNVFAVLACIGDGYYAIASTLGIASGFQILVSEGPLVILLTVILPAILIKQIRRGEYLAGILFLPLLLQDFGFVAWWVFIVLAQIPTLYSQALYVFNSIQFIHAGPFSLNVGQLGVVLRDFCLALIILIRSNRISRQQALLESEMASAREVQQVILPEAPETIPGYRIESVYEPAREVGGDFFQILSVGDGGMLLVIGDVAGKGLPAAMMVSVLVGAIRSIAEFRQSPEDMLAHLNQRMIGRTKRGFSTALAALFTADGSVSIANAGHLPPYLDGTEVQLPGALPLGIANDACYDVTQIRFEPGSRLTFYSDGVVEAQDKNGQLFGFERGREVSTQPAKTIVETAKAFGQQDDITVITVERVAVGETSKVERATTVLARA